MNRSASSLPAVLAALAVLAVLAATLAGCGDDADAGSSPTLGRELVEQQVRTQLGEEVGREPEQVTCPADLTGEIDRKMRCTLSDSGTDLGVTLTVTAVDGSDVSFDIVVDDAAGG